MSLPLLLCDWVKEDTAAGVTDPAKSPVRGAAAVYVYPLPHILSKIGYRHVLLFKRIKKLIVVIWNVLITSEIDFLLNVYWHLHLIFFDFSVHIFFLFFCGVVFFVIVNRSSLYTPHSKLQPGAHVPDMKRINIFAIPSRPVHHHNAFHANGVFSHFLRGSYIRSLLEDLSPLLSFLFDCFKIFLVFIRVNFKIFGF